MLLLAIVLGTLTAGIGSVWLAALLSYGLLARYTRHMLSLAAGALLATAFLHLLPEAFESGVEPHDLFVALLVGLVFFFLLDKAELWHHGHEHSHAHSAHREPNHHPATEHAHELVYDHTGNLKHSHAHGSTHSHALDDAEADSGGARGTAPVSGSWAVLAGDSVHCFGDGVLIASAFMADMRLGIIATLAVLAHEVPHHMGDLAVLRAGSNRQRTALLKVSLAGAVTALGGLLGYWLVEQLRDFLPYFLVVASSSFVYVALADLIPQLQKQLTARQTAVQVAWLLTGIALVGAVSHLAHTH